MNVEIISKECIKPSSPTPNHLKTHKLSLLDQFIPSVYIPIIFFYPINGLDSLVAQNTISNRSALLKESLSKTLTRFYPFAGINGDSTTVNCNGEGACYVTARIDGPLTEFLNQPDLTSLNKFVPAGFKWVGASSGSPMTVIQETVFSCGGVAIGLLVSHMVADGAALSSFLKAWSAAARNSGEETINPSFDAPTIFPKNDDLPAEAGLVGLMIPFMRTEKVATRRFVFDESAIERLKSEARSPSVEDPTRVEAISGLLCKQIMEMFKARPGGIQKKKQLLISQAVNLRRRAVPAIPESTMGNFLWLAVALCGGEEGLEGVATRLREAIAKIDDELVKKLQGEEGRLWVEEMVKERGNAFAIPTAAADLMMITSWCNFGLYGVDFGWGCPAWVSVVNHGESKAPFVNLAVLVDSGLGKKGIEAWVFMGEDDMVILEHDPHLLAHASVNPSM